MWTLIFLLCMTQELRFHPESSALVLVPAGTSTTAVAFCSMTPPHCPKSAPKPARYSAVASTILLLKSPKHSTAGCKGQFRFTSRVVGLFHPAGMGAAGGSWPSAGGRHFLQHPRFWPCHCGGNTVSLPHPRRPGRGSVQLAIAEEMPFCF